MYDQAGYNIKVLPSSVSAHEASGWFSNQICRRPQRSKDAHLWIRCSSHAETSVSAKLLSAGEIAEAMKKGDLDAAEFSMPSTDKACRKEGSQFCPTFLFHVTT